MQLYNGGNFLQFKSVNESVGASLLSAINSELFGNSAENSVPSSVQALSARYFALISAVNYAAEDRSKAVLSSEVGLYDHSKRVFVKRLWKNITGGEIIAVRLIDNRTRTIESTNLQHLLPPIEHKLLYSADLYGRNTLFQHIWKQVSDKDNDNDRKAEGNGNHRSLRVLTFNIWHNNPPNWVYPDSQ